MRAVFPNGKEAAEAACEGWGLSLAVGEEVMLEG